MSSIYHSIDPAKYILCEDCTAIKDNQYLCIKGYWYHIDRQIFKAKRPNIVIGVIV
jgi:hypothetical protein